MKTFACACFPYLRPYNSTKLQFCSTKCVFLGYSLNYRCLHLSTQRVFLSQHVVFDENNFLFRDTVSLQALDLSFPPLVHFPPLLVIGPLPTRPIPAPVSPNPPCPSSTPSWATTTILTYRRHPHRRIATFSPPPDPFIPPSSTLSTLATSLVSASIPHSMVTRAKDGIHKPNPHYSHHALLADSTNALVEPTSFSQANTQVARRRAMVDDFNTLQSAGTWVLVPPTSHMNILPNKWVFRIKCNSDGSIQRYRARLFNWVVRQLDVQNAFLRGYLSEDVFMKQPTSFVDPQSPHLVCQLKRSLYRLKQAPRTWFHYFSTHLEHLGFIASASNSSLFNFIDGPVRLYLLIYVDDILITGNDPSRITRLIMDLGRLFSMKDSGPVYYFLGMEVARTPAGLSLTQTKYRQLAYTDVTLSWFRELQLTLTRPKLWCDNISAIFLASNPVFHTRTRHVEVDYHYIREKVVRQKLEVGYLLTHDQIADIFTKGLSSHRFRLLVDKLHVRMVQQNQVHLGEEECKLQE
ncbi:hypothetical protein L3X38_044842 [Prunus dulcis]|uniref:Reverse transcriptase Ty1/copia-type domain-containing protein n=1 Tax=Prunus dulcis TaxID=3755 RepID=A0AAD4YNH4_PRUDU|nr:hypothetical protein L3X38_044842 [Prunus dulcis]